MKKLTIAISGMNATDNPSAGISVARSLRQSEYKDCRIVGLSYGALEPGNYMRDFVDVAYQLPNPSEGSELLFSRLAYIQQKEKLDVIIPNLDAELNSFILLKSQLGLLNIGTYLPSLEQFELRQKYNLPKLSTLTGIDIPESRNCFSYNDLMDLNCEFPLVVKGQFYEAVIVRNQEQLFSAFNNISCRWGLPIIVQRFVSGAEFNVIGLSDGAGRLLSYVAMRKQYITDKGKAWAGVTINDENLLDLTRTFVQKTSWKGPFELELIRSDEGKFYLIEVNPRIPAWVYLATASGQNIPELIVKLIKNEKISPNLEYEVGKMFIRCSWDMIVDFSEFGKFSSKAEL
ncbi:MAG: ATP-grasp domain-containing protein [Paludibacteraceae bacterium]|nr:ATP-grasp domain-containing protein [Paludibacteraceae bacterium]